MDRSLWLLLGLRGRAWVRRARRSVGTLKGLLLAVVGGLIFVPFLLLPLFTPRVQTAAQLDLIRRHGPALLLAYCLVNVLASPGDRAVRYSPAEVGFLFPGPFRRRDLMLSKVAGGLGPALVTALLMALPSTAHSASLPAALAGLVLGVTMVYLVSLAVSLAAGLAGSLAFQRGRRGLALAALAVAVAALAPLGTRALSTPPAELVARVEASPAVVALGLPFVPLVRAFAAERLWPDLAGWSVAALAVDLACLGLVLALDRGSLEASASAASRAYRRASAARKAGPWSAVASGPGRGRVGHSNCPTRPGGGASGRRPGGRPRRRLRRRRGSSACSRCSWPRWRSALGWGERAGVRPMPTGCPWPCWGRQRWWRRP